MQKTFLTINIPKLPVLTAEEGIKQIKINLNQINDWTNINDLIPEFYSNKKMKKTGLSGIFAASLELTKEGVIKILQEKIFEKVMIKRNPN
jgi:segregation and condensation protein A